jgi:hypothetical protein
MASQEQRRVRAIIDRVFRERGLPPRTWPDDAPTPPRPPPATPGETRKVWLGTFEIGPDVGALLIPAGVSIEDAADVILEASFQQDLAARADPPEPPPKPPVAREGLDHE